MRVLRGAAVMVERTEFVSVEGGYIAAAEVGSGPPLVLVHGSRASRGLWGRVLPYLAPSFRCISYDQRGCGESTAGGEQTWDSVISDLAAVVDRFGLERPLLVGHSFGGKIALVYAAARAECGGVFCIDGVAFGATGTLFEDVYDRIGCPARLVFAARAADEERDWPYTPVSIEAFGQRHPDLPISWLPCGHMIPDEMPEELARLVLSFAAGI